MQHELKNQLNLACNPVWGVTWPHIFAQIKTSFCAFVKILQNYDITILKLYYLYVPSPLFLEVCFLKFVSGLDLVLIFVHHSPLQLKACYSMSVSTKWLVNEFFSLLDLNFGTLSPLLFVLCSLLRQIRSQLKTISWHIHIGLANVWLDQPRGDWRN